MSQSQPTDQRRETRKPLYRTVRWDHRSGENQTGALCDITSAGTFLTPFGRAADQIRDGDTVWIVIDLNGEQQSFAATIRWHGWSDRHACSGFGVQFDGPSQQRAKSLMLDIDHDGWFFVPT